MVRLRSKYLRSILALSIGAFLVLSIWAFWESRRAAQLEDALREVRMELGRVQREPARTQVPGGSAPRPGGAGPRRGTRGRRVKGVPAR